MPCDPNTLKRFDLVAPGLNTHSGLPLFCDVTILSPLSKQGKPRGGSSNRGGALFDRAQKDNNDTYHEVIDSGVGALLCLACETFGRFNDTSLELIESLAREMTRGLHFRIRVGLQKSLIRRWFALLSISLQTAVGNAILRHSGCDLPTTLLEPIPRASDLLYL